MMMDEIIFGLSLTGYYGLIAAGNVEDANALKIQLLRKIKKG